MAQLLLGFAEFVCVILLPIPISFPSLSSSHSLASLALPFLPLSSSVFVHIFLAKSTYVMPHRRPFSPPRRKRKRTDENAREGGGGQGGIRLCSLGHNAKDERIPTPSNEPFFANFQPNSIFFAPNWKQNKKDGRRPRRSGRTPDEATQSAALEVGWR